MEVLISMKAEYLNKGIYFENSSFMQMPTAHGLAAVYQPKQSGKRLPVGMREIKKRDYIPGATNSIASWQTLIMLIVQSQCQQ